MRFPVTRVILYTALLGPASIVAQTEEINRDYRPRTYDVQVRQFKIYPDYRLNSNSPWSPGWEPPALPEHRRFPVTATFTEPGNYVVRILAHDGGLTDHRDVRVTVR